mgnify:CR=1 FL=1
MEYMSCPEAAEKWGISERRVQILCKQNRIPGVSKIGYMWLIPKSAVKPFDKRIKTVSYTHLTLPTTLEV